MRPPGVAVMCVALRSLKTLRKLIFVQLARSQRASDLLATPISHVHWAGGGAATTLWQRVAYLDPRAKEKLGRTLLERSDRLLGFMSCDAFEDEHTTALFGPPPRTRTPFSLCVCCAPIPYLVVNLGNVELRDDAEEVIGNALTCRTASRPVRCFRSPRWALMASYELNAKTKEVRDAMRWLAPRFCLLCGIVRTVRHAQPAHPKVSYCMPLARHSVAIRACDAAARLRQRWQEPGDDLFPQGAATDRAQPVQVNPRGARRGGRPLNKWRRLHVGGLTAENQATEHLSINPGAGAEGGKILEALHSARASALRMLDRGACLGDRGGPMVFASLGAAVPKSHWPQPLVQRPSTRPRAWSTCCSRKRAAWCG